MADTILRNMIADFLDVGTESAPKWVLMGTGFNSLDENPSAQIDTKAYINDKTASSIIKGYQTTFPFDTDLIESEEASAALYDVGRNQKQGKSAEFNYIRVEVFRKLETGGDGVHPARNFRVAVQVNGIAGAGAEVIHVTGNLNTVGNFVDGKFDIDEKVFTELAETTTP